MFITIEKVSRTYTHAFKFILFFSFLFFLSIAFSSYAFFVPFQLREREREWEKGSDKKSSSCLQIQAIEKFNDLSWFRFHIEFMFWLVCVWQCRCSLTLYINTAGKSKCSWLFNDGDDDDDVDDAVRMWCELFFFSHWCTNYKPWIAVCILSKPRSKMNEKKKKELGKATGNNVSGLTASSTHSLLVFILLLLLFQCFFFRSSLLNFFSSCTLLSVPSFPFSSRSCKILIFLICS